LHRESNQACEPKVIVTYSLIGNENGFSSEEETEQSNKQTKKKKNAVVSFFESWIPWK
jgi:hypothetical protein